MPKRQVLATIRSVVLRKCASDRFYNLLWTRKAVEALLGHHRTVHTHLKDASMAWDQCRLNTQFLPQDIRRPGGSREVVSGLAVLDFDHLAASLFRETKDQGSAVHPSFLKSSSLL